MQEEVGRTHCEERGWPLGAASHTLSNESVEAQGDLVQIAKMEFESATGLDFERVTEHAQYIRQ